VAEIIMIVLAVVCVLLAGCLFQIKMQLRNIRKQLYKRNTCQSRNALLMELPGRELQEMVAEMNKVLACEEALRIDAKMREQTFKYLIASISHDLRTPLTVTKGFLQLLQRCSMDEEGKKYLAVCMEHTEELEQLLSEFFAYSYWVNEENEVALQEVNLSYIVENVMADFVPLFEKQGLSMQLVCQGSYKVLGEKELLHRVMGNILKNCLAYAAGEVQVSIIQQAASCICVCVSNHLKEGHNPDMEHIFERFYTADNARSISSGLGLSIVKLLIEKMNGEVFAELSDGVFAVGFRLFL